MKSKTKLFEFLSNLTGKQIGLDSNGVSNETYGKNSKIYLHDIQNQFGVSREELRQKLSIAGFPVSRTYGKTFEALEVGVSYFKGYHWDV